MKDQNVCVVGLGYIGLPTASVLASSGFQVLGLEVNPQVVETINQGEPHIYEPDLDGLVHKVISTGALKATVTPTEADIFMIAVPTPFKNGHEPDISYIESAMDMIAPVIKPGNLVILESTSPVGTTRLMAERLFEKRADLNSDSVHFAYCPERVLPGKILHELIHNDRVVGGLTDEATKEAEHFYQSFIRGQVYPTTAETAEMVKLAENSYRDVNIAFANELANISDQFGIDPFETIELANKHPRVQILQPGPGVGGHCIAVDPWFIVHSAPDKSQLIHQARKTNDGRPALVVKKTLQAIEKLDAKKIACCGLSFKANIDDLRESPAIDVVNQLKSAGLSPMLVEPNIEDLPQSLNQLELVSLEQALETADLHILLVDHKEFLDLKPSDFDPTRVIDTRGILRRLKD